MQTQNTILLILILLHIDGSKGSWVLLYSGEADGQNMIHQKQELK